MAAFQPIQGEPNFYRDGDAVMFCFPVSEGHIIGPREATDTDKANHAASFAHFEGTEAAHAVRAPSGDEPKVAPKKKAPKSKA